MQKLNENWITEKCIDFEYKKYILLAYFQEVNNDFSRYKLYPALSDILTHYRNTLAFKENKEQMLNSFPKRLTGIDTAQLQLQYEQFLNDETLILEIENIISFSLPKFKYYLEEGKKIYDFIEEHLSITPVGMVPLHTQEGYLLLKDITENNVKVYQYCIKLFNTSQENYRAIYADFLDNYHCTFSNTFENIKLQLIQRYKELPNPATYAIDTDLAIPFQESYLPIAKRMLVRYLSGKAA